jgi:ABC-2 type transport system ATP-binding protein
VTQPSSPAATAAATPSPLSVQVTDLHVHHGDVRAVDGASFEVAAGSICAVLGRNGAGKTTLLSTLAAYRRPTSGTVRIGGHDPYERLATTSQVALVVAGGPRDGSASVSDVLEVAALLRPGWDGTYADRLLDRFGLARKGQLEQLSTGMRSALSVVVGLAARAPLTMFDEPHLGMDAPSRYAFYDELLADYVAHPRTILLSTHLIDEIATLVEDVVILDHGRVVEHRPVEELRALGAELTGPAEAVERLVAGRRVLSDRGLGRTRSVVVFEALDDSATRAAHEAGVDVGPIPLQDLFVHLTSQEVSP